MWEMQSMLKGPWHQIFKVEYALHVIKQYVSHSKLAKFEWIQCRRKLVLEDFFILQLNHTEAWQHQQVMKWTVFCMANTWHPNCTPSDGCLSVTKANYKGHVFMYCKCCKRLRESEAHHGRHVLDNTYVRNIHMVSFLHVHIGSQPEIVFTHILWYLLLSQDEWKNCWHNALSEESRSCLLTTGGRHRAQLMVSAAEFTKRQACTHSAWRAHGFVMFRSRRHSGGSAFLDVTQAMPKWLLLL